jgi:hypothetical protein
VEGAGEEVEARAQVPSDDPVHETAAARVAERRLVGRAPRLQPRQQLGASAAAPASERLVEDVVEAHVAGRRSAPLQDAAHVIDRCLVPLVAACAAPEDAGGTAVVGEWPRAGRAGDATDPAAAPAGVLAAEDRLVGDGRGTHREG